MTFEMTKQEQLDYFKKSIADSEKKERHYFNLGENAFLERKIKSFEIKELEFRLDSSSYYINFFSKGYDYAANLYAGEIRTPLKKILF